LERAKITTVMILGCLLASALPAYSQARTARLSGRVVSINGRGGVGDATVSAVRVGDSLTPSVASSFNTVLHPGFSPQPPTGSPLSENHVPEFFETKVDPNGRFSFTNLREGSYVLCATSPTIGLLDPCRWQAAQPTPLTIAAGQQVANYEVEMLTGREFEVLVADVGGILERPESLAQGAEIVVGVWGGVGQFQPANLKQKSTTGRTYSVVVPFEKPVRLDVRARRLILEDEYGKEIAPNDGVRVVTEPASDLISPRQFRYTVKSLQP